MLRGCGGLLLGREWGRGVRSEGMVLPAMLRWCRVVLIQVDFPKGRCREGTEQ